MLILKMYPLFFLSSYVTGPPVFYLAIHPREKLSLLLNSLCSGESLPIYPVDLKSTSELSLTQFFQLHVLAPALLSNPEMLPKCLLTSLPVCLPQACLKSVSSLLLILSGVCQFCSWTPLHLYSFLK